VDEKIYSKYQPKFIKCVRFIKDFDSDSVLSIIKNAKSQIQFLEHYNKLKNQLIEDVRISEFKKLNSGYSSIIKRMVEKEIFEYYDVEVKRNIIDHDFNFKLKHAIKFLESGAKVKAYVHFYGRTIVFKERGEILLLKLAQALEDYANVEELPKLEGKRMFLMLSPKK